MNNLVKTFCSFVFFVFAHPVLGAPLCAQIFQESYFHGGRLHDLKTRAEQTSDWQIQQDIARGYLAQAARRAANRGFKNLAGHITKALGEILENSPIKDGYPKLMEHDGTEVYWVEFTSGVKAIFKPETRFWMKDGLEGMLRNNPQSELVAYKLSQLFGLSAVPVTVIREIDGKVGSLQAFVFERGRPGNLIQSPSDPLLIQAADILIFDYVIRNIDRSDENIIFDGDRLWAIDHGSSFHKENDPLYKERPLDDRWVGRVSPNFIANLQSTTPGVIRNSLRGLLKPELIEELIVRHQDILQRLPSHPISRR